MRHAPTPRCERAPRCPAPWGRRGSALLPPLLAAALLLAGCRHASPDLGPRAALPIEAHLRLERVVVVARSEGPLQLHGGLSRPPGWDELLPATLHEAFAREVAAEARRLGLAGSEVLQPGEPLPAAPPAIAGPPVPAPAPAPVPPAGEDGASSGEPPSRPAAPPSPPAGVGWLEVRLVDLDYTRLSLEPDLLALSAIFDATLTVPPRRPGEAPLQARRHLRLHDPAPRPGSAWASAEGAPIRAAADRLLARAAQRIAEALLGTVEAAEVSASSGEPSPCGPAPEAEPAPSPASGGRPRDPAVVRWKAWRPEIQPDAQPEVTYQARAWPLDAEGAPGPVTETAGLSQTALRVAPLGVAHGTVAWTVRGVATLPGGRVVATPWSQAPSSIAGCAADPGPALSRRLVIGDGARPAGSKGGAGARPEGGAPKGPVVDGRYLPREWKVKREGLGPSVTPGKSAAVGAGQGVGVGLQASVACGPFFPVCVVPAVVVGAGAGLVVGLAVGGVSTAVASTYRTEHAALADGPLRTALDEAARRLAGTPGLAQRVEEAARRALELSPEAGGATLRLTEASVTLLGGADVERRVSLSLQVAGRLEGGAPAPREGSVTVAAAALLPPAEWVESPELLAASLQALEAGAGRELAEALSRPPPAPVRPPEAADPGLTGPGLP